MWLLPVLACSPSTDLTIDHGGGDTADSGADSGDSAEDSGADSGDSGEDTGDDPLPTVDVFVVFTGEVVTLAGGSTWLPDAAQQTPVSGRFAYASATPDTDDGAGGWYAFRGASQLEIQVGDRTIAGSWDTAAQLDGYGTFRFIDGTMLPETKHPMTVDGTAAADLGVWTAFTDEGLFPGEALPNPFPTVDPTGVPHTFLITDDGGDVLIQLDSLGPADG